MKLIAHRGLMNGPDPIRENTPEQIHLALINGFDVEVDVWWKEGQWWLGHDEPKITTSFYFLKTKGLWIHCKNEQAFERFTEMSRKIHYFWHETDCYTLTSQKVPWIYPGRKLLKTGVCVLPEQFMDIKDTKSLQVYGICSDYVSQIKDVLS